MVGPASAAYGLVLLLNLIQHGHRVPQCVIRGREIGFTIPKKAFMHMRSSLVFVVRSILEERCEGEADSSWETILANAFGRQEKNLEKVDYKGCSRCT